MSGSHKEQDWSRLSPEGRSEESEAIAEVLRRLLATPDYTLDPWLSFPQNACSFAFGKPPRPLPIGALRILWDEGIPFKQPCPDCKGRAFMVSFGGLLTIGGGRLICSACGAAFFQSIGSLSIVATLVGTRLNGTEFAPSSMKFGGAVGTDGSALLAVLGLPTRAIEPEDAVVCRLDGGRAEVNFQIGNKTHRR